MDLNLAPVNVNIVVETPTVTNEAFYNLCFITENDVAPRTVEINSLADLLANGYKTTDAVYNFCFYVFLQNGMSKVYVRNKRSDETYEQAFDADDNSNYYYCVIESKDISKILTFNTHLNTVDKYKLQFFSSKECVSDLIQGRKIVFYYDETLPTEKHTLYASRLYPYFFSESVTTSSTLTGIGYTLSPTVDSIMFASATMSGVGELRSVYNKSINICSDAVIINNAAMVGSGELRGTYKSTNIGSDAVTINNATMSGVGEMKAVYITHNNGTDAVTIKNATMSGTGTLQ